MKTHMQILDVIFNDKDFTQCNIYSMYDIAETFFLRLFPDYKSSLFDISVL